jgi:deoxyxylulose-5-phosphate synthase
MYQQVEIQYATAPMSYPGINNPKDSNYDSLATGIVGAAAGAAAGYAIAKKKKENEVKEA